jgi:hypothetical protein
MTLPGFLAHWPFQVPNLLLAMLMYTLAGRLLLGLILSPGSDNYIMRFFERLTDPVVRLVREVTPGMVPLPVTRSPTRRATIAITAASRCSWSRARRRACTSSA